MAQIHGQLDHVVLLVPYDTLKNPPSWITDNFTLSPGGKHGDNKTENRLVIFEDGTYLELIAFIDDDPEKRKGHWWDRPFGVVDFALTTSKPLDHEGLQQRLEKSGTGVSYGPPKTGGRVTNGNEIKWEVTFPQSVPRGNVPFFCEDVTKRQLRVPVSKESTTHPSETLGMAGVTLEVKADRLQNLGEANAAILNEKKEEHDRYRLGTPIYVERAMPPTLKLQEAAKDSERDLELILTLQSEATTPKPAIREKIGDGVVKIDFERTSL